ncbi:MAG TPA: CPBP family intramembrane glutamic endopeptidase [Lacunisphaera sp.]|nr:CPBP family intramembrane glutamic endopeptidase [Lacunisphaera sp.]
MNSPLPSVCPSLLPHARVSLRGLLWSFLAGLAITLPVLWLVNQLPLPGLAAATAAARAQRLEFLYLHPGLLAVKALLIYPLLEEFFYRGLVQQMCRRYLPTVAAVAVPNAIFAFTHIGSGWINVVFALLVGLFFSWLVIRSNSLLPSMVCHAAINAIVLFVLRPLGDTGTFVPDLKGLPGAMDAMLLLGLPLLVLVTGWRVLQAEFRSCQPALAG